MKIPISNNFVIDDVFNIILKKREKEEKKKSKKEQKLKEEQPKEVVQEKNDDIKKDTEKAIKNALREVERIVISIAE